MTTGTLDMVDPATVEHIPLTCEHSRHGDDDRHHGDAEWIQYNGACICERAGTALVCDRWRQWVSDLARMNGNLLCMDCMHVIPAHTMTYTRI